ncbi:hypothetical protein CMQ_3925 [Grosmannia clavigera kw1407]|uniref:Uncharacterized protein n=1 Tax=Grosmannia clavigera (strain kw1407 / UAMH 11150) TaxID=655863 RepID=F0X919_GROCL|nr:uncharacterized protein CMQ_3925 [Grosmannia clavigera kw1407]EFX05856.1 hypothetical protein CMQ_3925 [Grosmannia clavigera kw1407]
MASRQALLRSARTASWAAASPAFARSFQTSARFLSEAAAPLPARKPVGAFRGGLFGFLLGTTLSGSAVYYYVLQEYKASNDQLTDDIYTLQRTTQQLSNHLSTLEDKLQTDHKK